MLLTRRVCLLVLVGFALAVVVVPITLFVGDDDDSTLLVLRGSVASATPSVEHRVSLVPSPRPLTVAPPTTSRPPATSAPARSRAATYTPLSPELSSRVHRWANGTAFVDEPLPDTTGLIPRRLFLTWKATVLPLQAANLLQTWQTEEPQLEIIVVDDADCAALAERFLRLKPRYDALPMNVMRADICRVLLIYFFGGLYKDLDVQWAVSLDKWLAWTSPVEYGLEDEEHVCQWFFAARPGNPCIRHVLQHITNIIESLTEIDFNQHVEAVIEYTGPGAFTDGMRGCPTQAKFSVEEMRRTNIIHQYAAAQWTQSGYASWLEERKLKAGWQGIWAAGLTLDYFVLQPQSRFTQVGPDDRFPPLTLQRVKMSSVQWSNDYFFGPHLAFDGSLDTSIVSNVGTFQWLEIRFAKPMTIGTVAAASEDHLCGMRIYNGKRPHLNQEFNDGVVIELYSPRGRLVMVTTKRTGTVTNHFIAFGGVKDVIQRIRVVRAAADTRLVLSEVQLFSDPALRRYRRTVLNWTIADMDHPYVPLVAHLLHVNHTVTDRVVVTNEPRCAHSTGVSLGNRFLFALCSPPGEIKPCAAVILSDKAKGMTIDDSFAQVMHRSCAMLAFAPVAPHANTVTMHTVITPWNCSNASNGTACESLELAQRKVVQMEARTVSVLLDLEESDWGRDDSLIRWIVEGPLKADTLLIEVRVGTVASRQARRHLERLSMRYRLVAWYPVVDDGYYEPLPRLLMPRTVQTTWVVRQEVPRSS